MLVLQWKTDNMQDVQFQLRDGVVRMNQIEMLDIKSSIADEECLWWSYLWIQHSQGKKSTSLKEGQYNLSKLKHDQEKKKNQELWNNNKWSNLCVIGTSVGKKEKTTEENFEK